MEDAFQRARRRLTLAKSIWAATSGPASAFIASAARLGWQVFAFNHVADDQGNEFFLDRDPPALVKEAVVESVRRWQMRRVAAIFPEIDSPPLPTTHRPLPTNHSFRLAPLQYLLRRSSDDWGPAEQSQLRSAIVGGQWTQLRLYQAGCAESPLCPLCGRENGTMAHRLWRCTHPSLAAGRAQHVPAWVLDLALSGSADGHTARWERALFPVPELTSARNGPFETFVWDVEPEGGAVQATFYPDGSRCGGADPLLASYGWAFVARDDQGRTLAAAHGVPPKWVRSVAATETWALAMAALSSIAHSCFRTDCLGVATICARGRKFATAGKQICATVWGHFFRVLEDDVPDAS